MELPSLLALSCGLAMDAFAVSIAMGVALPKVRPTQMARLALGVSLALLRIRILQPAVVIGLTAAAFAIAGASASTWGRASRCWAAWR